MGQSSVYSNRSAFFNSSADIEFDSGQICNHLSQLASTAPIRILLGKFIQAFRHHAWQRCCLASILTGLVLILIPTHVLAAQVTMAWDANNPAPEGYRVFQRIAGQAYDYAHPVWPTDGNNHTETTCTITNLTADVAYYFVVRAYVGSDQSGDSNEISYQANQPAPSTFTISTSAGANGSISPSGDITVTSGANQRVDISPNSGYHITAVTVDGQSVGAVSSYTFSNVSQNHTISANFAATTYTISASAGQGGSISPSGSVSVAAGASRTFSFSPNSGYQTAGLMVDGQSISIGSSHTFSNVTRNHTISVSFSSIGDNNRPPTAEAGANKTVTEGDSVVLNGSASADPDGDTLTYRWLQSSGPIVALSAANSPQCAFTAPYPNAESATLVFELTVTDSKGLSAGDTCVVLVNAVQQLPDNDGDGIIDDLDDDDDNDGMPDVWEIRYNLDPFGNDAGQDPDNDGISNLEEYQAGSDPTQDDGNHPPEQPALTSPAEGESNVALNLWLKASEFNDPDSSDQHAQTQWRIALSSGTQQIVLDRTCAKKHLTEMRTPRLVLDPSTEYSVQVRFFDNHGEPSLWSSPVTFATEADERDMNKNKIPDSQEVSIDTDMNGDAIPDLEQATVVKSLATYNDQHIMAVSIDSNGTAAQIQAVTNVDPMSLVSTDYSTPYPIDEIPYGLLGYKIKVDRPGESVRATIHLSDPIIPQQTQWINYDEIHGMQNSATATTIDESGLTGERYLIDGGDEDADGVANGIIVDLSGPRVSSTPNDSGLAISTDSQGASGESGSSCFIRSLF
jgi:hypothetical protein